MSNEVFVGAGVSVSLIPESRINLGNSLYQSYGRSSDNKNTLVRYSVGALFRDNFKMIPDLYAGCQVKLFDGTNTTFATIASNDVDSIYLGGKLADFPDLSGGTAYAEIMPLGAPLPSPILKGVSAKFYDNITLSDTAQTSVGVSDGSIYNVGDKLYSDASLSTLVATIIGISTNTLTFLNDITPTANCTNGSATIIISENVDGVLVGGQEITLGSTVYTVKKVNGTEVELTTTFGQTTNATVDLKSGRTNHATISGDVYVDEGRILLADNWLGLTNTVSPPTVEVEMKQMNLAVSGSRNFAYQYKGAETVSGGSMDLSMNNGSWLYYALGKMSALSATHSIPHTDGAIQGLAITNAGANLTDGTYLNQALTGGDGSNGKADITVSNNVVSAVSVHTAGSGYSSANSGLTVPAITLSPDRPFAAGADIFAQLDNSPVSATDGSYPALATTSDNSGAGATVTITVNSNQISAAEIVAVGDNYSVGDKLIIDSSLVTGAGANIEFTLVSGNLATVTQPTFEITSTSNPVDSHKASDVPLTADRLYMVNDAQADDISGPYFHRGIKGSNALIPPIASGTAISKIDLVNTPTLSGTTISNPFEYVYGEADSDRLPSFALEVNYAKTGTEHTQVDNLNPNQNIKSAIVTGNQINSLTLNFEEGQELKCSLDFSGLRYFDSPNKYVIKNYRGTDHDTTVDRNLTNFSSVDSFNKPFFYFDGAIKVFGQNFGRVKTGSLVITNNLTQHRFIGNYNRQRMSTQIPGQRTYELSFTLLVTDNQIWKELRNDLEFGGTAEGQEIQLNFTKDNNEQIAITLKDYLVSASNFPIPDDKGPIEVEMTVMARNLETCTYTGNWMLQG